MRYIMRYKARVHVWWELRHWWYNHVSGPVMNFVCYSCRKWAYTAWGQWWYKVNWYQSPLGRVVFAIRCWDGMVRTNEYLKQQADGYLRAGNELRDDMKVLREALEIQYEGQQDQLELLLAEAEANIAKREYVHMRDDMSEPF